VQEKGHIRGEDRKPGVPSKDPRRRHGGKKERCPFSTPADLKENPTKEKRKALVFSHSSRGNFAPSPAQGENGRMEPYATRERTRHRKKTRGTKFVVSSMLREVAAHGLRQGGRREKSVAVDPPAAP